MSKSENRRRRRSRMLTRRDTRMFGRPTVETEPVAPNLTTDWISLQSKDIQQKWW